MVPVVRAAAENATTPITAIVGTLSGCGFTTGLPVIGAVVPMAFVGGLMGPYMRPIPVGASAAMFISRSQNMRQRARSA